MRQELLYSFFRDAWNKDTCYEPWQSRWGSNLPEFGQCVVTSLYVYTLYGGSIVKCNKHNHYWNVLPGGEWLDLTRSQFSNDVVLTIDQMVSHKKLLGHWNTMKRFKKLCGAIKARQLHDKYHIPVVDFVAALGETITSKMNL